MYTDFSLTRCKIIIIKLFIIYSIFFKNNWKSFINEYKGMRLEDRIF